MIPRILLAVPLLLLVLLVPAQAFPVSERDIIVTPPAIAQGEVGLVTMKHKGDIPTARWMGKTIALVPNDNNERAAGFLAVDLTAKPGRYTLFISSTQSKSPHSLGLEVVSKDRGVRRFTVPKEMVELDSVTLKRVRREIKRMREVLSRPAGQRLWRGAWILPVSAGVVSRFGCRTIINGHERSPHSGVDLRAGEGTPVKATNRGRIVFVADHFFSGRSVVADHGAGIQSMYFHLSHIPVKVGQLVEKGAVIGLSGSSGRVTGPHLHFGIRINGGRVDPIQFIEISRGLEGHER
jgi:murein DD-endopeptidase MepM/ murein hydrolase activator NlpD